MGCIQSISSDKLTSAEDTTSISPNHSPTSSHRNHNKSHLKARTLPVTLSNQSINNHHTHTHSSHHPTNTSDGGHNSLRISNVGTNRDPTNGQLKSALRSVSTKR